MLKTVSGRGYRLLGAWTSRQESTSSVDAIDLEPMRSPAEPFYTNLPAAASELVGLPYIPDCGRYITLPSERIGFKNRI
jgi:hypothetical protein